ncbi:MAG: hypothetical protein QXR14_02745 [Sulfolobales archaeon]
MRNVFSAHLLIIIISILSLLPIPSISASIHTYPPTQISINPTPPPIMLQDPGTPGVSVSLGTAGTSASISVSLSLSYSIHLQTNPVVYYNTLDQFPLTDWITSRTGSSSGTTTAWVGGALQMSSGAVRVTYYSTDIVDRSYNGFYNASAYVMSGDLRADRVVGIAYVQDSNNFYGCGIGDGGGGRLVILKRESGSITKLARTPGLSLSTNTWYFLVCGFNPSTGEIRAYLYNPANGNLISSISYTDTTLSPSMVGFFVWRSSGVFDELVAVQGADPLRIAVNNVPSGWNARLYNGSTLLQSITSTGSVIVFNNFWYVNPNDGQHSTILRQGRIEVYDNNGNLKAVYGPAFIIGGQIFSLSTQTSNVIRILNIGNTDSKNYYGILTLHSYSSSGFSSISIYLCNPSTCSTPITIPPGSLQTGEVVLPLQEVSYIMLEYSVNSAGASADIAIHLRYSSLSSQNGVLAIYPIEIHVG